MGGTHPARFVRIVDGPFSIHSFVKSVFFSEEKIREK